MWNYGQPGYMFDGSWMWGMGLHAVLWLVFLVVVIAAGIALVRHLWRSGSSHGGAGSGHGALDILKARYARGEIDREEFLARKKDLGE